jgi:hypothetical protein
MSFLSKLFSRARAADPNDFYKRAAREEQSGILGGDGSGAPLSDATQRHDGDNHLSHHSATPHVVHETDDGSPTMGNAPTPMAGSEMPDSCRPIIWKEPER